MKVVKIDGVNYAFLTQEEKNSSVVYSEGDSWFHKVSLVGAEERYMIDCKKLNEFLVMKYEIINNVIKDTEKELKLWSETREKFLVLASSNDFGDEK